MRLALLLWVLASPAHAIGKVEGKTASLEAVGNLRLLGAFLHFRDLPLFPDDDALLAGVGRLILKGNFSQNVTYDMHVFLDLSRGPLGGIGGTFATVASAITPYRTRYLAWDFWNDGAMHGSFGLDRASVNAQVGRFSFTAGRFPINDSVARMFTPNDFFAPFSATSINRNYKPGVDALRVGVSLGKLSGLELTGVLGSDASGTPTWGESAFMVRMNTVLWGFDAALLGGKLAERWVVGGSFQGEIGPVGLRGEGHAGFADVNGDGSLGERNVRGQLPPEVYGRLALGAGYRSTWHNLSIDAEYAWFSDGAAGARDYLMRAQRFFPDDLPYLAQHYVGVSAAGEILPILRAGGQLLVNCNDASGLAVLTLSWDVADEVVLLAGLLLPWGDVPQLDPRAQSLALRSEYGASPLTIFLESRFYF